MTVVLFKILFGFLSVLKVKIGSYFDSILLCLVELEEGIFVF